jgi:Ca2+-binding EF-hand superfamily protein
MSEVKNEIDQIFIMFRNESNKIPNKEIINALRCAGLILEDEFVQKTLKHTSDIDLDEFKLIMDESKNYSINKDKLKDSFSKFDLQNTGYIKASDLSNILLRGNDPMEEADVKIIFEAFPPNEQGMICYSLLIDYIFN